MPGPHRCWDTGGMLGKLGSMVLLSLICLPTTGALDGTQLHWAAAPGPHRGWGGVPGGWQTEPTDTRDAGTTLTSGMPDHSKKFAFASLSQTIMPITSQTKTSWLTHLMHFGQPWEFCVHVTP